MFRANGWLAVQGPYRNREFQESGDMQTAKIIALVKLGKDPNHEANYMPGCTTAYVLQAV